MIGREVRVALAGVGSCASSLVQAVELARQSDADMPGIMYASIGPYRLADVRFVAVFEVDRNKIGLDLAKAIFQMPTAAVAHVHVEPKGLTVECGPVLDGIDGNLRRLIEPHEKCASVSIDDVRGRLVESRADVLVCVLPTGATAAVQAYARAAALAGVAFVNATPEPVAHEPELVTLFEANGAPLLGDDLRSHLGATTLHTALLELLQSRHLAITNTYQLNIGGNSDFLNLSDTQRAAGKLRSKRNALNAAGINARDVSAGPNGYVAYLGDTKACFIRIEATSVLDSTLVLDIRLEVEDSPNAAGVLANAIRLAKVAADQGHAGVLDPVCPFLFKSPRYGATESEGLRRFTEFVESVAVLAEGDGS
ncbi:inositol-3-phosphate synthase [Nonomuraea sp. NPDC050227]|uniref:inositol-3-phosphate synthase n=1 Tax=Nonomuraea sp. NPDC050227 TaxID=3364360 RepID=UPI00379F2BC5